MNDKLYAWADTTNAGIGDHTWVTSYKINPDDPRKTQGKYWNCHGDFHDIFRLLDQGNGGLKFAEMISEELPKLNNVDIGIKYAHDGLCHQMANRLLRFTINEKNEIVTVKNAKGYQLTAAMYGEYGGKRNPDCLEQWENIVLKYQILIGEAK